MIYAALRWITGIALHWFYAELRVVGRERIPADAPILLAASHHNALVDGLIAGWLMRRRITLTAKATLLENPLVRALFKMIGVIPLRRASDELKRDPDGIVTAGRNTRAFDAILDVLEGRGIVLLFPEGKSHNEPELAPLKSGLARIALQARDVRRIPGVHIVPLGLNFENKAKPGSSVIAEVGEPVSVDHIGDMSAEELTQLVAERLRGISLKPFDAQEQKFSKVRRTGISGGIARAAASWGEFVHRYPVRAARMLALRRSNDRDQPAMLTILYGLTFILGWYVLHAVLAFLLLPDLLALLYLLTLPAGAYWAAFYDHAPEASVARASTGAG